MAFKIPPKYVPRPTPPRKPTPLPFNARADNAIADAGRNYAFGTANIDAQRQRTEQSYGFTDPTNPFSQAALLQRSYQQQQTGTLNSMARQGQLYSGAMSNARYNDSFNFGRSYDELSRNYENALQELDTEKLRLGVERDSAVADAETQRLEAAVATPVDPSTQFAGYLTRDPNKIRDRMARLKENRKSMNRRGYRRRMTALRNRYNKSVDERRYVDQGVQR